MQETPKKDVNEAVQLPFGIDIQFPHDGFAKYIYGNIKRMRGFLEACIEREEIPAGWLSREDLAGLTCINTNLIKSDLEQTYVDLLFMVRRKDGSRCYVHFESANTFKGDEPLRLYNYKGGILTLDNERYKRKKDGMGLPIVIQVFFYTGPKSKKAEEMAQLARPTQQLADGLDRSFCFASLYPYADKTLLKNNVTGPAEVLMKHARKRGVLNFLRKNRDFAALLGTMDYGIAAGHLAAAMEPNDDNRAELLHILFKLRAELTGKIMSTLNPAVAVIENRGRQEGRQEGKKEGIQEGYRAVAQRMHERGADNSAIADAIGWTVQSVQQMFAL